MNGLLGGVASAPPLGKQVRKPDSARTFTILKINNGWVVSSPDGKGNYDNIFANTLEEIGPAIITMMVAARLAE